MANKTVVKIGKMASTVDPALLYSVQNTEAMQNGSHVILGAKVTGHHEVYACTAPKDVTKDEVLLVESPVIVAVNGMKIDVHSPLMFENAADMPARARKLQIGDTVTMTVDGFASAPTAGKYAVPADDEYTLAPANDLSGATLLAYYVLAKTSIVVGRTAVDAYELRVVKA